LEWVDRTREVGGQTEARCTASVLKSRAEQAMVVAIPRD
jgi:hypothetical protein